MSVNNRRKVLSTTSVFVVSNVRVALEISVDDRIVVLLKTSVVSKNEVALEISVATSVLVEVKSSSD